MKSIMTFQLDYFSLLIPLILLLERRFSHILALLLAATIHEMGHLLAARILKVPISALHISILGARIYLGDSLLSYQKEWLLCAAGPLFSFLFAATAAVIFKILPNCFFMIHCSMISSALGLVNLLPIGWLDGGRMFRATCYLFFPHTTANTILRTVSFIFFLLLWMTSVYLLLRVGNSLSLFAFSFSLFLRFFISERK